MNIAGMRVRITIQKNETDTDSYGNDSVKYNTVTNVRIAGQSDFDKF